MKKLFFVLSAILLTMFTPYLCEEAASADKKPSVVATIFPQYDFARTIAGDKAELTMLLRPGMESHSYDPTPQDILKIQNCDIFIYGGGESDEWVDEVL